MYSRLINYPKSQSFFLLGPRGTGKSTWLKETFPSALYIDLLKGETALPLRANPSRLESLIPSGFKDWIIIDEVQKIPELLDEVHRLIELRKLRFILTGSSARKLRKKGVNLLAGRALNRFMHPLTIEEMKEDYSFQKTLKSGFLPASVKAENSKDFLMSYVDTYLKEEVQQEGISRNLGGFSRFLEAASFSQGEVLNISEVARECHLERKLITSYFSVLEDLLIAYRIPCFSKRAKRDVISHPKFFLFDVGVFQAIRPRGPLDSDDLLSGAILETVFFQQVLALNDYFQLGYKLYFWRTKNKLEVDFVLYGERGLKAFEIKRSPTVRNEDLKGLKGFSDIYPEAECYLLYGGENKQTINNITYIPFEDALKNLKDVL